MICRIWHGWTTPENADPYEQLLRSEIFAGIASRRIPGFLGIDLVRRPLETSVEFVTITGSVSGLENLVFASAGVLLSGTTFCTARVTFTSMRSRRISALGPTATAGRITGGIWVRTPA
jgi:hypothetical protein